MFYFHSQPEYSDRRIRQRSTWLSPSNILETLGFRSKVMFFMGVAMNSTDQQRVEYEHELYRDIIQPSFVDHYRNNTYKAMSFLL